MAEDRKEPPFEGGSQPVVHQTDPLPGAGQSVARIVTIGLVLLVAAAVAVYLLARL